MVNKLWYKGHEGEREQDIHRLTCSRAYIQKYIDYYCPEKFKLPEDITTENLDVFFKTILPHYQNYMFDLNELWCVGESVNLYFYRTYYDDFEEGYPSFPDSDRREISLTIIALLNCCEIILPEDVPFLLNCFDTPDNKISGIIEYGIEDYFKQFDQMQRANIESRKRSKVVKEQRLIAIANDDPLPIRPMGMKLDPCYKKDRGQ